MFYPRFELTRANDSLRSFGNLGRIFAQVNDIFDPPSAALNEVDVRLSDNGATLQLSIPGYRQDQLQVEVERDSVLIQTLAESSASNDDGNPDEEDKTPESGRYLRREIAHGPLSRRVRLPFTIDHSKTTAHYENGMLSISVEKPASEQARSIPVTAA